MPLIYRNLWIVNISETVLGFISKFSRFCKKLILFRPPFKFKGEFLTSIIFSDENVYVKKTIFNYVSYLKVCLKCQLKGIFIENSYNFYIFI